MRSTIVSIVSIAALLAGCGGGSDPQAKPHQAARVTANVVLELQYPLIADTLTKESRAPKECVGALDYSGVATGGTVTFKDAKGTIVGTAKLRPPEPGENLVICTWTTSTTLRSDSKFFTAEVGGWTSEPQKPDDADSVMFHLDTVDEDPSFGSTARVDPAWTR